MNSQILTQIADSNHWGAIGPEVGLGCLALLLLVLEILLPKKSHGVIPGVAIVGQLIALAWLAADYRPDYLGQEIFGGLIRQTYQGQFMRIFFVVTSTLVSLLATVALAKQKMPRIEFFHIVIVVSAAMMLLAQSNHFVSLFVS